MLHSMLVFAQILTAVSSSVSFSPPFWYEVTGKKLLSPFFPELLFG